MAKVILRKTESKVAVKLYGTGMNETVTLNADCLASTEIVSGTPTVNILSVHWSGAAGANATITRGGEVIATLLGDNAGELMFQDSEFTDTVSNTSNLVVTSTGLMQVWILLRKAGGYASKIETSVFSVYDNINAVGS
jgi:hypothetical protein